jgi:AraC family transcriptional regulator of adaptative response/methylated-DNA-[protein]-cysteine methyltransferase
MELTAHRSQAALDYDRIAAAIHFLKENFKEQPRLEDVAARVHLSPFHFQRMFREWSGVTPKQFLQYLSMEHARHLLRTAETSLFDAAYELGLSGTGRLHDLFIKIEGMTPGDFKAGGRHLAINYHFADSPFGRVLIATTSKGICYMAFADEHEHTALEALHARFPNATYTAYHDAAQKAALRIFDADWSRPEEVKLHLKGTPFQLRVWETLLKVPMGALSTYAQLAAGINNAKASRAVGSAVAGNPVAFLIPCHRVIRSGGDTGQYHWGSERKQLMIGWEAAKTAVSGGMG